MIAIPAFAEEPEIGGPSNLFKTIIPLYQAARVVDGVNFSKNTIWEGAIESGNSFNYYGNRRGRQFISDATSLVEIEEESYDFVLSSNCLEHIADPLRALVEWKRVLKTGGALILVLPNKVTNFDHRRPDTELRHLLDDFERGTTEHDLTHLQEILRLHDLSLDPLAGDIDAFKRRSLDNFNNRALHHHVFNPIVMRQMLEHAGFEVINTCSSQKDHFAAALKKNSSPAPAHP